MPKTLTDVEVRKATSNNKRLASYENRANEQRSGNSRMAALVAAPLALLSLAGSAAAYLLIRRWGAREDEMEWQARGQRERGRRERGMRERGSR